MSTSGLRRAHRVHNYYVGSPIARGSFCTVYEAYRKEDLHPCAVRLLSKRKLSTLPNFSSILFNEKIFVRLLSHAHIGKVTEIIESDAQLFQIMKFYPNGDLATALTTESHDRLSILKIFDEVLSGVEFCHSLHFCHLDLKPENVLVTNRFHAKLIDWSFATPCFEPILGQTCGSLGYVAPEVLSGEPFDGQKADIFSLGICLYFLFTGCTPIDDTRRLKHASVDYTGIDRDVAELIEAMICPRACERPAVREVRRNVIFDGLSGRPNSYRPLDVVGPIGGISLEVLHRLADLMAIESRELRRKLEEVPANCEKVLYYLAAENRHVGEQPDSIGTRPYSLPVGTSLSELRPFLSEHGFEMAVAESQHRVVDAILGHLFSHKFLVAVSKSGTRTCVLNREKDDVCLEIDFVEPEQRKCVVVVRDMNGTGESAFGHLERFISRKFRGQRCSERSLKGFECC